MKNSIFFFVDWEETPSDTVVNSVLVLVATFLNDTTLNRLLKIILQERMRLFRGQQLVLGGTDLGEKSVAVDGGVNPCQEDVCAVLGADAFIVQLRAANQKSARDLDRRS